MQISEINSNDINKICQYSKNYFACLYIADSLGSLNKVKLKKLIKLFRKNWHYDMGIHAHDNLSLALDNTLFAHKNSINWLDCTINGMGRGPGNTKTEDLLSCLPNFNNQKKKSIKKLLSIFRKLKKDINGELIIFINYLVCIKYIQPIFKPCFQIKDIVKKII